MNACLGRNEKARDNVVWGRAEIRRVSDVTPLRTESQPSKWSTSWAISGPTLSSCEEQVEINFNLEGLPKNTCCEVGSNLHNLLQLLTFGSPACINLQATYGLCVHHKNSLRTPKVLRMYGRRVVWAVEFAEEKEAVHRRSCKNCKLTRI